MQLALAAADLDLAHSLAGEIQAISVELDQGHSYYGLWHLLTRVKWLYRTGQADAGVAVAMDAIPRIERMADRNLLERMQLLAAEGLGLIGRTSEGARLMATAVTANPDPPLEMMAEASRVAGRLTADDDPAAAASHFDRATRILHRVGNLTACAEIERDAREASERAAVFSAMSTGALDGSPLMVRDDPPPRLDRGHRLPAAAYAERIAALIDLAAHPPLLAAEALSLIADTDTALHIRIIAAGPAGDVEQRESFAVQGAPAWRDEHADMVTIPLGSHRDRAFSMLILPRPTAPARATLLAVERLLQVALALTRARHQEREQTALWPEPSPEQQLGLVCASERMLELVKSVRRVAPSNVTVLITGETGVGKELFARALHQASARHDHTFLPFNCTTVPRDIVDSMLFGYRRGAFTGAQDDSPGLIRAAAGGTTALFTGKSKFSLFPRSWPDGLDRYTLRVDGGRLVELARRDLRREARTVTFLHLAAPDVAGHAHGWGSEEYADAVRAVDGWLGDLLDTVAGKQALREHLTVVLTADHGGAGTGHADPERPEDYRIPFLTWGQGVAAGTDLYELNEDYRDPGRRRPGYFAERQPVRNADVANLALDLLGLGPVPGSTVGTAQQLDLEPPPA